MKQRKKSQPRTSIVTCKLICHYSSPVINFRPFPDGKVIIKLVGVLESYGHVRHNSVGHRQYIGC